MKLSDNKHDAELNTDNQTKPDKRQTLPCRGCTSTCSRYGRCEYKPWRLRD